MRRIYISGVVLKIIFIGIFYFMDLAMSSSGNLSTNNIKRTEHIQSISSRIKNDFSNLEDFKGLESGLNNLLRRFEIKGASIAVARDGRLVYAKGIGYADYDTKQLVEPGHMFRVASVSKLITAVTIMKMREFGLLELDDMVFGNNGILNDSIYLDYVDPRVEKITVRHLLNHSAGWNSRYGDHMFMTHHISREMDTEIPVRVPDIIKFALRKRLHFTPGSGSSYSNLGYAILGEIIASISGMSYEAYVKKTILSPLGIHDMRLGKNLETDRFENEVKYYEQQNAIMVNSIYNFEEKVYKTYGGNDIENLGAAGGWIASPAELLKLVVAIDVNSGSPLILSPESIEIMSDRDLPGNQLLGWTSSDTQGNLWRTGSFAGTSALVMRQSNGLTWAIFFNTSTYKGTTLARDVRRVVQPALNRVEEWPEHDLFYYSETPDLPLLLPATSLRPSEIR
jgi:CubicO group peptidase (beta-lactamase class C family)